MGQQAQLIFDHEQDRRPRRQVADWGGDEVFARTPRRRFKPTIVDADHGARPHVAEPARPQLHVVAPAPAVDAAPASTEPVASAVTDEAAHPVGSASTETAAEPFGVAGDPRWDEERAANGRRTVVITGRPGAVATARRRPPRTVEERVGARPDRVAAWACALGVTLILTAVATADAATRAL